MTQTTVLTAHVIVRGIDGHVSIEYLGTVVTRDGDGIELSAWEVRDVDGEYPAARQWQRGSGVVGVATRSPRVTVETWRGAYVPPQS